MVFCCHGLGCCSCCPVVLLYRAHGALHGKCHDGVVFGLVDKNGSVCTVGSHGCDRAECIDMLVGGSTESSGMGFSHDGLAC